LAFGIALELGLNEKKFYRQFQLKRVNGRFETLKSDGGIFFVVDYAHTPDALENVLDSINEIRTKNERLIYCFRLRRRQRQPNDQKWEILPQKSTLAIITSDNPRTEDPTDYQRN
jgi:UDP-N-acetylmuramoyl-L-alanyl-D-glutamate--2,6-diaminopimelate ligase